MRKALLVPIILCLPMIYALITRGESHGPVTEEPEFHPAVTAFFESEDPFVEEVVIPNIEANRKGDVVLKVTDTEGKPIVGAEISAVLKKHEFQFGHCDLATEKDPKKRALLNELFHFTCPGNLTKWRSYAKDSDKYDFTKVDEALDYCRENDITFEWHFLSGYHPSWLQDIESEEERGRRQVENSKEVLTRYGDKVDYFQVINEDWRTRVDRAKVYTDQTAWFSELRKEFPDVQLGVCDCWSFNLERRLPTVEELKQRYPGINFISMHAHNPRQLWASPKEMYETYDPYLDSNIMIHLTEFGIILGDISGSYREGPWDEDKLAEYFVQAMATAFSHKSVRVFNLWSNYEKFTGNPLFTEDGKPNEKYHAIKSLLHDKLTTRVSGKTDKEGRVSFRGFHGKYDLQVELPSGKRLACQFEVSGNSSGIVVMADEKKGDLRLAN